MYVDGYTVSYSIILIKSFGSEYVFGILVFISYQ